MSRFLRTTIFLALVVLIGELLVGPAVSFGGIGPDFALAALLILALAEGSFAACLAGFCIGLVQDIPLPELLGLTALVKSLVGFLLGRVRERLVRGMPLVEGGLLAVAALVHDGIILVVRGAAIGDGIIGPFFLAAVPSALYTALAGVLLIRLAERAGILSTED